MPSMSSQSSASPPSAIERIERELGALAEVGSIPEQDQAQRLGIERALTLGSGTEAQFVESFVVKQDVVGLRTEHLGAGATILAMGADALMREAMTNHDPDVVFAPEDHHAAAAAPSVVLEPIVQHGLDLRQLGIRDFRERGRFGGSSPA